MWEEIDFGEKEIVSNKQSRQVERDKEREIEIITFGKKEGNRQKDEMNVVESWYESYLEKRKSLKIKGACRYRKIKCHIYVKEQTEYVNID